MLNITMSDSLKNSLLLKYLYPFIDHNQNRSYYFF